jgi:hypothetical protein
MGGRGLGSEVGILLMFGELTAAQAAAAFRIASIYGCYEFYIGRHRSSAAAHPTIAPGMNPSWMRRTQQRSDERERAAEPSFHVAG